MDKPTKTIFVIDDDEFCRKHTAQVLEPLETEIYTFEDPEEALEKVSELDPFLLLLDYQMPQLNGYKFMVLFSEKLLFKDRSVFLITGADLDPMMEAAMPSLGIEKYFKKPLDGASLLKAAKEVLDELNGKSS